MRCMPASSGSVVTSEPRDAAHAIDEFLERFPQDPRLAEVEALRRDGECAWLQKRLALRALMSGGSKLEPHEQALLKAMRKRPDAGSADAAALQQYQDALRAFVTQYGQQQNPSPAMDSYLDAARHLLRRSETGRALKSSRKTKPDASLRRPFVPGSLTAARHSPFPDWPAGFGVSRSRPHAVS